MSNANPHFTEPSGSWSPDSHSDWDDSPYTQEDIPSGLVDLMATYDTSLCDNPSAYTPRNPVFHVSSMLHPKQRVSGGYPSSQQSEEPVAGRSLDQLDGNLSNSPSYVNFKLDTLNSQRHHQGTAACVPSDLSEKERNLLKNPLRSFSRQKPSSDMNVEASSVSGIQPKASTHPASPHSNISDGQMHGRRRNRRGRRSKRSRRGRRNRRSKSSKSITPVLHSPSEMSSPVSSFNFSSNQATQCLPKGNRTLVRQQTVESTPMVKDRELRHGGEIELVSTHILHSVFLPQLFPLVKDIPRLAHELSDNASIRCSPHGLWDASCLMAIMAGDDVSENSDSTMTTGDGQFTPDDDTDTNEQMEDVASERQNSDSDEETEEDTEQADEVSIPNNIYDDQIILAVGELVNFLDSQFITASRDEQNLRYLVEVADGKLLTYLHDGVWDFEGLKVLIRSCFLDTGLVKVYSDQDQGLESPVRSGSESPVWAEDLRANIKIESISAPASDHGYVESEPEQEQPGSPVSVDWAEYSHGALAANFTPGYAETITSDWSEDRIPTEVVHRVSSNPDAGQYCSLCREAALTKDYGVEEVEENNEGA